MKRLFGSSRPSCWNPKSDSFCPFAHPETGSKKPPLCSALEGRRAPRRISPTPACLCEFMSSQKLNLGEEGEFIWPLLSFKMNSICTVVFTQRHFSLQSASKQKLLKGEVLCLSALCYHWWVISISSKHLKKKVLHLVFRIFLVSGIFDISAAIENKKKTLKIYSASSECMFCPTFQKKKKNSLKVNKTKTKSSYPPYCYQCTIIIWLYKLVN